MNESLKIVITVDKAGNDVYVDVNKTGSNNIILLSVATADLIKTIASELNVDKELICKMILVNVMKVKAENEE